MNIKGKIALITGSSKGIGRATAELFAKNGATVIINYKSDDKAATEVLENCNNHSKGNIIIKADVSRKDEVEKMFETIKEKFGKLDVLVNNAGIADEKDNPKNESVFRNVFDVNFFGVLSVTNKAIPLMQEGSIVNISSVHGRIGYGRPETIAYSSAKAALNSYTKNLAKYLAPSIRVNAVEPGRTWTPFWDKRKLTEEEKAKYSEKRLINRFIKPGEIADGILFLIKNEAMVGEILTIDGGMTLKTLS